MNKTVDFSRWLQDALDNKGWNISDLSKKSGISQAHISNMLSGNRKPGAGALGSLAHALDQPLNILLQKAGYLPPTAEDLKELDEEWKYLITQAETEEEKKELIERARFELTRIRERRGDFKKD